MSRTGQADERRQRDILTPEGVRLTVSFADFSDRAAAALLDALAILTVFVVAFIALWLIGLGGSVDALAGLVAFFGRLLYFPLFELHWGGRTPGKRLLGLRVIGRHGAPLEARAIMARNLVREVEMWLPLTFLLAAQERDFWSYAATAGWSVCVAAIPLLNQERMRGGDLLAGTWVIREPTPILHQDLLAATAGSAASEPPTAEAGVANAPAPSHVSAAQLDAYGAKELNVLAELLHAGDEVFEAKDKARAVAEMIRNKIGYQGPLKDDRAFLAAYYRAARAKMATDAQWGRLTSAKHDSRAPPRGPSV